MFDQRRGRFGVPVSRSGPGTQRCKLLLSRSGLLSGLLLAGILLSSPVLSTEPVQRAKTLAEKVAVLIRSDSIETLRQRLDADDGLFRDEEIYAFVLDRHGIVQPHPDAEMIGIDMLRIRDLEGTFFIADTLIKAHEQTRFWMVYRYANPRSQRAEFKQVWVIAAGDYVVGAGAYVGLKRPTPQ